jgi:oligoribonuclease
MALKNSAKKIFFSKNRYPRIQVNKKGSHRALDDIIESIEELKYYRQHVFK